MPASPGAPTASARASRAAGRVLARADQRVHGAARRARGRSPCPGRRRRRPGPWRRPGRGGAPRRAGPGPSRPGRPAAPPPGCPPPARGWPGRSRPAARHPWWPPPGWPRAVRRPAVRRHRGAAPPARPNAAPWPPPRRCRPGRRPVVRRGRGGQGPVADSDHDASAGRTRVATQPGGPMRGRHRVGRVAGHVVGPGRRAVPPRDRAGDRRDVGLERRVVAGVVGGVVAHDVHDRRAGPPRVVQVGQPVAEPGPRCSSVAAGRPATRP